MNTFDESKIRRSTDGKFANKPHAEGDVVLEASQHPQWLQEYVDLDPQDQKRVVEQIRAHQIGQWKPRAYIDLLHRTDTQGGWPEDLPQPEMWIVPDHESDYSRVSVECHIEDQDYPISMSGEVDQDDPIMEWGPDGSDKPYDEVGQKYDRPEVNAIMGYAYGAGQELLEWFGTWNPDGADGAAANRFAFPTLEHPEPTDNWGVSDLDDAQRREVIDVLRSEQIGRYSQNSPLELPEEVDTSSITVEYNPWNTTIEGSVGENHFWATVRGDGLHNLERFRLEGDYGREMPPLESAKAKDSLQTSLEEIGERAHELGSLVGSWDGNNHATTTEAATKHILGR